MFLRLNQKTAHWIRDELFYHTRLCNMEQEYKIIKWKQVPIIHQWIILQLDGANNRLCQTWEGKQAWTDAQPSAPPRSPAPVLISSLYPHKWLKYISCASCHLLLSQDQLQTAGPKPGKSQRVLRGEQLPASLWITQTGVVWEGAACVKEDTNYNYWKMMCVGVGGHRRGRSHRSVW